MECMNGLLVNNESESALLTSFLMIGKYFYTNLQVSKRPDLVKKCGDLRKKMFNIKTTLLCHGTFHYYRSASSIYFF